MISLQIAIQHLSLELKRFGLNRPMGDISQKSPNTGFDSFWMLLATQSTRELIPFFLGINLHAFGFVNNLAFGCCHLVNLGTVYFSFLDDMFKVPFPKLLSHIREHRLVCDDAIRVRVENPCSRSKTCLNAIEQAQP